MAANSVPSVVCLQAFVGSPVSSLASVHLWKSVRDKLSNESLILVFSQNYTEEQNSQRPTEILSQPMTQSVTANVDTNKEVTSCLHPPHMGISVITPLPFGGGDGGGANWLLVCEVTPIGCWRDTWVGSSFTLGRFFSHRTHRSNRTFLRTVSNSQKASGIQISQNVTAKDGC